ncbi:MAG: hypothetical protein AAFV86_15675 [Pseudomonadota bacterium]
MQARSIRRHPVAQPARGLAYQSLPQPQPQPQSQRLPMSPSGPDAAGDTLLGELFAMLTPPDFSLEALLDRLQEPGR